MAIQIEQFWAGKEELFGGYLTSRLWGEIVRVQVQKNLFDLGLFREVPKKHHSQVLAIIAILVSTILEPTFELYMQL